VALDDGVKRPNLDYHSRSKQSVSRRSRCESFAQFWTPERDVGGTDGVFRGILTISLDADLQDIAAIKTMVEFFYEGNDIVLDVRTNRGSDTTFKRISASWLPLMMRAARRMWEASPSALPRGPSRSRGKDRAKSRRQRPAPPAGPARQRMERARRPQRQGTSSRRRHQSARRPINTGVSGGRKRSLRPAKRSEGSAVMRGCRCELGAE
jgi:hypothetical protein